MIVIDDSRCEQHIDFLIGLMDVRRKMQRLHTTDGGSKIMRDLDKIPSASLDPASVWHPFTQGWVERIIGCPVKLTEIRGEGRGAKRCAAIIDICLKVGGDLLTIDKPETGLHPAAQAEMASFLAAVALGESLDPKEPAV